MRFRNEWGFFSPREPIRILLIISFGFSQLKNHFTILGQKTEIHELSKANVSNLTAKTVFARRIKLLRMNVSTNTK